MFINYLKTLKSKIHHDMYNIFEKLNIYETKQNKNKCSCYLG